MPSVADVEPLVAACTGKFGDYQWYLTCLWNDIYVNCGYGIWLEVLYYLFLVPALENIIAMLALDSIGVLFGC